MHVVFFQLSGYDKVGICVDKNTEDSLASNESICKTKLLVDEFELNISTMSFLVNETSNVKECL